MKNLTYKFFLRGPRPHRKNLYIRITSDRKSIIKSLNVSLKETEFNEKSQTITGNSPQAIKANILIHRYKNNIGELILHSYQTGQIPSLQEIKEKTGAHGRHRINTLSEFINKELLPKKAPGMSPGTVDKYKRELNKILRFYRKDPLLKEINENFIANYHTWLKSKRAAETTLYRSLRFLKTFANEAHRAGLMEKNTIQNYKTKHPQGKRDFLTINELNKIAEIITKTENPNYKNTGLAFLLCCYTGLRYSDCYSLKKTDIEENFLRVKTIKTGESITIPRNTKINEILAQVLPASTEIFVFKPVSNQKANQRLKKIISRDRIEKNVSFHVARHTFAVISIELEIPTEVIQKILGHRSIKTTQIYAKIMDKTKESHLRKWDLI